MEKAYYKKLELGKIDYNGTGRRINPVYLEIRLEAKEKKGLCFSITGEIWNGNCSDLLVNGQCMEIIAKFFQGNEKVQRIIEIWKRWNLNDMNPGCEHQKAEGWGTKKLEVIQWQLKHDVWMEQDKIKERSIEDLKKGKVVQFSEKEKEIMNLPFWIASPGLITAEQEWYEIKKKETKSSGWVSPEEHPDGVLGKPCSVCGYKYGTSWNYEEIPADIIEEIKSW